MEYGKDSFKLMLKLLVLEWENSFKQSKNTFEYEMITQFARLVDNTVYKTEISVEAWEKYENISINRIRKKFWIW